MYKALLDAFLGADDADAPLYAGYLASYGDERALPSLLSAIEREDIGYVLFQELKFAIEALGGEYDKERDFSNDPAFDARLERFIDRCGRFGFRGRLQSGAVCFAAKFNALILCLPHFCGTIGVC